MNRSDLQQELVQRLGLTPKAARAVLDVLFDPTPGAGVIPEALDRGERVSIAGFGTFELRKRPSRRIGDPRGGTRVLPAERAVAFRAADALRGRIR